MTRISEFKTLTKNISYDSKWIFDGKKNNSIQKWNNEKMLMSMLKLNKTLCKQESLCFKS